MICKTFFCTLLCFGFFIGNSDQLALAAPLGVTLDTSAFSGTAAQLAFDLVSVDPSANFVTIANFSTDGLLGAALTTDGPVTGVLPNTTTIADTAFFNELLQDVTLGSLVAFTLDLTANHSSGSLPDQFSFFLIDTLSGLPLFATADPTGADALFTVDITGTTLGDVQVFAPNDIRLTTVPEPASWMLLLTGLGGLAVLRHWLSQRLYGRHYSTGTVLIRLS